MLFVKSSFLNKHELGATHVPAQINVAKYRNVRNKRISGVAARPRADCDDDTLLIYRRVSKMSTLVETNHTQLLPVLEEVRVSCQVQRCPWAADDPVPLERRMVTMRS